jgi:hypothetical protein
MGPDEYVDIARRIIQMTLEIVGDGYLRIEVVNI